MGESICKICIELTLNSVCSVCVREHEGGGGRKERKNDSEVNQKNPDHKSYDVPFHWGGEKNSKNSI